MLQWLSASGVTTDEVLWKTGTLPHQIHHPTWSGQNQNSSFTYCTEHEVYLFTHFNRFISWYPWRWIRSKLKPYLTNETVCCGVRGGAAIRAFKTSFSSCSSAMRLEIKVSMSIKDYFQPRVVFNADKLVSLHWDLIPIHTGDQVSS